MEVTIEPTVHPYAYMIRRIMPTMLSKNVAMNEITITTMMMGRMATTKSIRSGIMPTTPESTSVIGVKFTAMVYLE